MNTEALIFALLMSLTQYLMARSITGQKDMIHSDNLFWMCPLFYPITLFIYLKKL